MWIFRLPWFLSWPPLSMHIAPLSASALKQSELLLLAGGAGSCWAVRGDFAANLEASLCCSCAPREASPWCRCLQG